MRLLSLLIIISISVLSGCNTAKGVGEDVTATGDAITRAATQ